MLAEIEYRHIVVIKHYTRREIHTFAGPREFRKFFHIILKIRITVKLTQKNLISRLSVGKGGMCVGEIASAIELVCGYERALLHLVEDILHIYEFTPGNLKIQSGSAKLLDKQRNIELIAVISGNVTPLEYLEKSFGNLAERRLVFHHLVGDVMHGCRPGRYGHAGIEPAGLGLRMPVGINFDITQFYYPVSGYIGTGGFQIKENQRSLKIQFHYIYFMF